MLSRNFDRTFVSGKARGQLNCRAFPLSRPQEPDVVAPHFRFRVDEGAHTLSYSTSPRSQPEEFCCSGSRPFAIAYSSRSMSAPRLKQTRPATRSGA